MTLQTVLEETDLLTAGEVVDATPISYRQLLYWTERKLVTPAVESQGSGSYYLYPRSVIPEIEDLVARIDACPYDHDSMRRPRR